MTKDINHRLEVVREKRQNWEKIVKKQKTEVIVTQCQITRGEIDWSSEKKQNYKSNTKDKTNLDLTGNNKYPLQISKIIESKL